MNIADHFLLSWAHVLGFNGTSLLKLFFFFYVMVCSLSFCVFFWSCKNIASKGSLTCDCVFWIPLGFTLGFPLSSLGLLTIHINFLLYVCIQVTHAAYV